MTFKERVLFIVSKIPAGKTMSYKQVAQAAGNPHAARAVGNVLSKNFNPAIPCHRVIKSNGELAGYNRGLELKKELLANESRITIP